MRKEKIVAQPQPLTEKKKFKLSNIPAHILLLILVFINIFPLYWMLTFSLKGKNEIMGYKVKAPETRWEETKAKIVDVIGDVSDIQWNNLQASVVDSIQANLKAEYRTRAANIPSDGRNKARDDYTAELQQIVNDHWEEILGRFKEIDGVLSSELVGLSATDEARVPVRAAAEAIVNDFLRTELVSRGVLAPEDGEPGEGAEETETFAVPGDGDKRIAFTFTFSSNKWKKFCDATDQIVTMEMSGVEDPWENVKSSIALVMGDQADTLDGYRETYVPPNNIGLPHEFAVENYPNAFSSGNMGTLFLNSIFVTAVTIIITIIAAFMATYAITRLAWKGRKTMNKFFMLGLTIPIHAALVPVYIIMNRINLLNTLWSLILPYSAFSLAMGILISIGFMGDIPYDLDEAAFLDGCGVWGIFFRVIIPLMMPAISTIGIYTFLQCWNELLLATVYISKSEFYTLPVGINTWASTQTSTADWGKIGAGLVIATAPTLIVYIALSKKIQAGFIAGAVKG